MTTPIGKAELTKMLLTKDYRFPDDPFEPSSDKPIDADKLTSFTALKAYLDDTYATGEKLGIYLKTIKHIMGDHRAEYFIELNKSEYFKVLTHFTILSIVKRGWFNLFVTSPIRTSKPSLSDLPSRFALNTSKKLHDSIIWCFYARLTQGMTAQEKERYPILLPHEFSPSGFDGLLVGLDTAIQDFFSLAHQNTGDLNDERLLPDAGSDEAIKKTRSILLLSFSQNTKDGYRADTLRAALIKLSALNRAINSIAAILNIYDQIIDNLPNDIASLIQIESESEILPALIDIFAQLPSKRKKTALPNDLMACSKLVCQMYMITSQPPTKSDVHREFNDRHRMADCIAVSAALLYHDFLRQNKLNLNIRGETNKSINVYKTLSELAKKIPATDLLKTEDLWTYAFPEDLFKFLTARYSISVMGLSPFYPSQQGAAAHLNVKIKKLVLQKEAYELLKDMSVKDGHQCISNFYCTVQENIAERDAPIDE